MTAIVRIEQALERALAGASGPDAPPRLADALRYAVFPSGARIRPKLCLAVAEACGDPDPTLSDAAAASIELLHCASLVHDDLPCFDDADTRRGRPSLHKAFGEPLAVLAGDALIILAFETLARNAAADAARLPALVGALAGAVGMPSGIVAGQAWESEAAVSLSAYHRAKTASLFAAATVAGAIAAGRDPNPWRPLGERLGEAYQVADDILDAASDADAIGKPIGRDSALGRPSAPAELGLAGAANRLKALLAEAVDSIPDCPGQGELRREIADQANRFILRAMTAANGNLGHGPSRAVRREGAEADAT